MKRSIGQPRMINKVNRDLIKRIVARNSPISKPQLARISKLSLPTVNKTVDAMLEEGIFKTAPPEKVSGVGRRAVYYELNGNVGYIVALYIENEYANGYIKGALVDLLGEIIYCEDRKISYRLEDPGPNSLFGFIDSLMEKAKVREAVRVIAAGIPGIADDEGNIYRIPNITAWEGINLKEVLEKRYGIPAYIENDVNLTAVGVLNKYFQDEKQNIIYMYFGEGIGAGIIVRGKLFKGKNNFAGEFSHMIISDPASDSLGKYRSEGLYSREFLPLVNRIMRDPALGKLLRQEKNGAAILEDRYIKKLIQKVAHLIINMVVLLNPEAVAIRGCTFNSVILEQIGRMIGDYVGVKNCPELLLLEDKEIGLDGTIRLGLSHSASNYALVNDKGI